MASTKLMTTKDGKRFWKISVSRGHGVSPYTTRFYWPTNADGSPAAKRTAERELAKAVAEFEAACAEGRILSRAEEKQRAADEESERAKLKAFKQYAEGVFLAKKRPKLSENAYDSYVSNLKLHAYPAFGDQLLVDITPAMCDKLLTDFQVNHSHASTIKLYNILNGVFKMAAKDDSIQVNPLTKIDRPTPRNDEVPDEENSKAYTIEELNYILDCIENEPLKWRTYINLMADTGMRKGECCGVQWADIDFKNGTLTVRNNLQYLPGRGVKDKRPKNKRVRTVDIGPDVVELLRQLRDEQASSCISKYVFSQNGSPDPMHPQRPTRYFKKLGERYGIEDFHPHKLRHTSVSIALAAGADLASVSERAGHSNPAVTARIYAHSDQEGIRRAGNLAREALEAARKKKEQKPAEEQA